MARLRTYKTNFTAGEVSPHLLGRGDLRAYDNGAKTLNNVFVHPTGGVRRRPGLRYLDTLPGKTRLITFEFNTEQVYLLALSDLKLDVYRDDVLVTGIVAPWSASQLDQINWVQSADTLLVVHPDVPPKKITRTSDTAWTLNDWVFVQENDRTYQPHHKFADDDITLTPSATTGTITLTASADVFTAAHVSARFRLVNKEVEITGYTSATQAQATVKEALSGTTATKDWEEQSFSAARGWPVAVCFHQDRLVIGGARDLPNRLWMSKSADLYNFDLGTGLDDDSIEFALLADQVNAIRAVFSGRHLQVFTSGAEWMVSGEPLTPGNVQLNRQTRIGSPIDRTIPPRDVDGATLFIPRDGTGLREFLFADVEQAYQSNDLATLAPHMISQPVDLDYHSSKRQLHVVDTDGTIATVTIFRAEQVTAWSRQQTDGEFRSLSVTDNQVYVAVERNGAWSLERFDETCHTDAALTGTSGTPQDTWSGLAHLNGSTVAILADNAVHPIQVVSAGVITLETIASSVEVGLPFHHLIAPLPPIVQTQGGGSLGARIRPVAFTFRLHESHALRLDSGRGFREIPFKRLGDAVLDSAPSAYTGDRTVRAFGWRESGTDPLWTIEHDAPLPFTLLSVAVELSVNG